MATLLAGDSGHYSYAPLSQGQTMSICQHLESMIRELRSQFGEMRRDLTNTDSTMAQVRNSLGSTNASVQGLQEAQVVSTNAVDTLKRDVDRTGNKVNKLGVNLESVADVCNSLKESQKVMKISYQQLKQGLATLTERANHVDKVLESSQAGIHTELREQLQHAMVGIKGLRDDHQCTKSSTQELREGLRSTNGRVQGLGEDINKITTHAGLMEHRLGEACVNLKATRQSLAETNAVALKSHEDHRQTKANLGFTQEGVKKCASHVKQLHEAVDLATTKLNNTQDQVQRTIATVAYSKELIDATVSQVRSLRDDHEMVSAATMSLRAGLQDTAATMQSVQADLREANQLVLPNLRLDITRPFSVTSDRSMEGRKTSSRLGKRSPHANSVHSPGVSGLFEEQHTEQGDPFYG